MVAEPAGDGVEPEEHDEEEEEADPGGRVVGRASHVKVRPFQQRHVQNRPHVDCTHK